MKKDNIKISQINLNNKEIRKYYSEKLKDFENEFSYPLGSETFKIRHGNVDDYFSFFDQMGDTYYFVAENNNKIVGAGCAILRLSDDNKKYWYLCDFKITKEYRGKNILEKMLAKYFLKCVVKSHRVIAVNMNNKAIDENGLVKKVQKLFWFLNIEVQWLNLHQWSKKDIQKEKVDVGNLYTNIGKKDIIIKDNPLALYHVVSHKDSYNNFDKFTKIAYDTLPEESAIMCSVLSKEDIFSKQSLSGTGVVISAGMKNVKISTLEI